MTHPDTTFEDTEHLQQMLRPVLRIVMQASGLEAALRLANDRGGVRLYIPHKATPDHDLVPVITMAGLEAISGAHAGESVDVPKIEGVLRTMRDLRIYRARQCQSVSQIARDYGLTRRRVQQIVVNVGVAMQRRAVQAGKSACGQLAASQLDMFK